MNYFGYSCSRLFAVLLSQDADLTGYHPCLINDRWKTVSQNTAAPMKESSFAQLKFFTVNSKKKAMPYPKNKEKMDIIFSKTKIRREQLESIKEKK